MIKQTLPAVSIVTSENFETFSKSDKVVVMAYFDAADTTSNETFTAVANSQRDDFLFGASNDAALIQKEGVTIPGVVMYKTFDDAKTVYSGALEQSALRDWVKHNAVPLMGEVGPETYTGYIESGLPLAYIFVENADVKKRLGDELTPIARKFRGKINFATIDAVQFGGHANNLNLFNPI
jgi:protein disulfide-isomerase A1